MRSSSPEMPPESEDPNSSASSSPVCAPTKRNVVIEETQSQVAPLDTQSSSSVSPERDTTAEHCQRSITTELMTTQVKTVMEHTLWTEANRLSTLSPIQTRQSSNEESGVCGQECDGRSAGVECAAESVEAGIETEEEKGSEMDNEQELEIVMNDTQNFDIRHHDKPLDLEHAAPKDVMFVQHTKQRSSHDKKGPLSVSRSSNTSAETNSERTKTLSTIQAQVVIITSFPFEGGVDSKKATACTSSPKAYEPETLAKKFGTAKNVDSISPTAQPNSASLGHKRASEEEETDRPPKRIKACQIVVDSQSSSEIEVMPHPIRTTSSNLSLWKGKAPRLAFSNCATLQGLATIKKFLKQHKAIMQKSTTTTTNVLILGGSKLKTTLKVLLALALAVPIVTESWLTKSMDSGQLLAISAFKHPAIASHDRSMLLRGKILHVTAKVKQHFEPYSALRKLAKAIGAICVVSEPCEHADNHLVLVLDKDDAQSIAGAPFPCYLKDIITDGIVNGELDVGATYRVEQHS